MYGGFIGGEADRSQRDWKLNATVLDGNAAGQVVTMPSGATATTRIDGFTIRNGKASPDGRGGGLYCYFSSPTIINTTITGNSASRGGGFFCYGGSPTIANTTITGNSASLSGGGIYCDYSSLTIINTTITENSGGGIYCDYSSPDDHQHDRRVQLIGGLSGRVGRTGPAEQLCLRQHGLQLFQPDRSPPGPSATSPSTQNWQVSCSATNISNRIPRAGMRETTPWFRRVGETWTASREFKVPTLTSEPMSRTARTGRRGHMRLSG